MYVIVVYDIEVERLNDVRKFLKRFLHHVQRSVFEGKITKSQLFYILRKLKRMINPEKDSIIIYVISQRSAITQRISLGSNKFSFIK